MYPLFTWKYIKGIRYLQRFVLENIYFASSIPKKYFTWFYLFYCRTCTVCALNWLKYKYSVIVSFMTSYSWTPKLYKWAGYIIKWPGPMVAFMTSCMHWLLININGMTLSVLTYLSLIFIFIKPDPKWRKYLFWCHSEWNIDLTLFS